MAIDMLAWHDEPAIPNRTLTRHPPPPPCLPAGCWDMAPTALSTQGSIAEEAAEAHEDEEAPPPPALKRVLSNKRGQQQRTDRTIRGIIYRPSGIFLDSRKNTAVCTYI